MNTFQTKGSGRLFKSPFLEALSRTSPTITLLAYTPVIVVLLAIGIGTINLPIPRLMILFITGVLSWTLVEYLLHRFVFHFIHQSGPGQRFHYLVHGIHHHFPKDEARLFMPPIPGYIIASLLFSSSYVTLGHLAFAFFPGMMTGYLAYVFTHYAIHRYKKPRNWFGYVWDHHNLHHFKYPDKAYGVSTPLWDLVFGTMPPK